MAIGTAAALIGSAVIGAGASAISASKNSKAINKATDAQTQATNQNNALTREIYGQNKSILTPYINSGYQANSAINALLGLPTQSYDAPTQGNALAGYGGQGGPPAWKFDDGSGLYGGQMGYAAAPLTQQAPAAQPVNYQSAFQNYLNSTGYQFRLGEGSKALNASFAARGLGNSGAAAKAALNYGQNIASGEFANYLGYLGNQQGVGLSAGSALAGVGQNYVNTISANNNNQASTLGNAAIAKANNSNALIGNIAGSIGSVLGGLSSYGGGGNTNAYGIRGAGPIY